MTIAERYTVRPDIEDEVWLIEPNAHGLTREDVERDVCVAWDDPVTRNGVLRYEGIDWEYIANHNAGGAEATWTRWYQAWLHWVAIPA